MTLWKTAAALAVSLAAVVPAQAAVGVSVEISQPGVYGRVDIGRFPTPEVVLPRPVIIHPAPPPRGAQPRPAPEPVYLWVPPGHRKNWRRHCERYHACGHPVYFVRDDWYDRDGPGRERGRDGREDRRDRGHRGDDRGDDRGPGQGRGHGQGHGDDRGHGRRGD